MVDVELIGLSQEEPITGEASPHRADRPRSDAKAPGPRGGRQAPRWSSRGAGYARSVMRILVVDDEPVTGLGITELLRQADFEVVDTVASVTWAVERVRSTAPDLIVCDVMIEGQPQGLEMRAMLAAAGLESVPVLHLSSYDLPSYVQRARDAGAMGYLPKTASLSTLERAVRMAVDGKSVFPGPRPTERIPSGQEIGIMRLVAAGFTSNEIGMRTGSTEKSVDKYLERLFARYRARSRAHLAVIALEQGWITRADVDDASKSTPPLHSAGRT